MRYFPPFILILYFITMIYLFITYISILHHLEDTISHNAWKYTLHQLQRGLIFRHCLDSVMQCHCWLGYVMLVLICNIYQRKTCGNFIGRKHFSTFFYYQTTHKLVIAHEHNPNAKLHSSIKNANFNLFYTENRF